VSNRNRYEPLEAFMAPFGGLPPAASIGRQTVGRGHLFYPLNSLRISSPLAPKWPLFFRPTRKHICEKELSIWLRRSNGRGQHAIRRYIRQPVEERDGRPSRPSCWPRSKTRDDRGGKNETFFAQDFALRRVLSGGNGIQHERVLAGDGRAGWLAQPKEVGGTFLPKVLPERERS